MTWSNTLPVLVVLAIIPVVVFYSAKLGIYGFLSGRKNFERDNSKPNKGNGHHGKEESERA